MARIEIPEFVIFILMVLGSAIFLHFNLVYTDEGIEQSVIDTVADCSTLTKEECSFSTDCDYLENKCFPSQSFICRTTDGFWNGQCFCPDDKNFDPGVGCI